VSLDSRGDMKEMRKKDTLDCSVADAVSPAANKESLVNFF